MRKRPARRGKAYFVNKNDRDGIREDHNKGMSVPELSAKWHRDERTIKRAVGSAFTKKDPQEGLQVRTIKRAVGSALKDPQEGLQVTTPSAKSPSSKSPSSRRLTEERREEILAAWRSGQYRTITCLAKAKKISWQTANRIVNGVAPPAPVAASRRLIEKRQEAAVQTSQAVQIAQVALERVLAEARPVEVTLQIDQVTCTLLEAAANLRGCDKSRVANSILKIGMRNWLNQIDDQKDDLR